MFTPFLELLASNTAVFVIFVALLSLLVGSFLNVVIYRLPIMMQQEWDCECRELLQDDLSAKSKKKKAQRINLLKPDSHCPSCKSPVKAWQNIPIVSYLLLRGKCGHCGEKISLRYPAIELLTAISSAMVAAKFGYGWQSVLLVPVTWAFICLIFIDIDHMLLPDQITLPLLWLALLVSTQTVFISPTSAIFGAVFGYLSLWSVYWLFRLLTGKEGMGYGDFKLMAIVGAIVGAIKLPMVILMSSLVGALFGIINIVFRGSGRDTPMPFGPYIAIAGWIVMLWGDVMFDWYIQFLV
ncbi:MAG: prepilin peptidase [Gammaproteobacteria bacterium]|nr:prepilin peptidase [Gammaproteobacteria bacterium]